MEPLPPHIPTGAVEKTEFILSINPIFKNSRFFYVNGKCYSFNPNSFYNGIEWLDFVTEIQFPLIKQ